MRRAACGVRRVMRPAGGAHQRAQARHTHTHTHTHTTQRHRVHGACAQQRRGCTRRTCTAACPACAPRSPRGTLPRSRRTSCRHTRPGARVWGVVCACVCTRVSTRGAADRVRACACWKSRARGTPHPQPNHARARAPHEARAGARMQAHPARPLSLSLSLTHTHTTHMHTHTHTHTHTRARERAPRGSRPAPSSAAWGTAGSWRSRSCAAAWTSTPTRAGRSR
jgi:hypothetical protein